MDQSFLSASSLNVKCMESQRYQKFTLEEERRILEDEETGVDSSSSRDLLFLPDFFLDKLFLSVFLFVLDLEVRLLSSVESIRFTWLGDASNL